MYTIIPTNKTGIGIGSLEAQIPIPVLFVGIIGYILNFKRANEFIIYLVRPKPEELKRRAEENENEKRNKRNGRMER